MQGKNIGENLTQHPYYLPNISKSVFTGTKKSDPKEYILYCIGKKKTFFFLEEETTNDPDNVSHLILITFQQVNRN